MGFSLHSVDDEPSLLKGQKPQWNSDLDSSHCTLTALMEVLQRNFKRDTCYERPMISPQANLLFALDKESAYSMVAYMSERLQEVGFEKREFRFIHKLGINGEVLQRIRLEFTDGVNAHIIRKLLIATDRLEKILPPYST